MEPQDIQTLFNNYQDSSVRYNDYARQVTGFVLPDFRGAEYVSATTANEALKKHKEFIHLENELEIAGKDMENNIKLLVDDLNILQTTVVVFDFERQKEVHIWAENDELKYQVQ